MLWLETYYKEVPHCVRNDTAGAGGGVRECGRFAPTFPHPIHSSGALSFRPKNAAKQVLPGEIYSFVITLRAHFLPPQDTPGLCHFDAAFAAEKSISQCHLLHSSHPTNVLSLIPKGGICLNYSHRSGKIACDSEIN